MYFFTVLKLKPFRALYGWQLPRGFGQFSDNWEGGIFCAPPLFQQEAGNMGLSASLQPLVLFKRKWRDCPHQLAFVNILLVQVCFLGHFYEEFGTEATADQVLPAAPF